MVMLHAFFYYLDGKLCDKYLELQCSVPLQSLTGICMKMRLLSMLMAKRCCVLLLLLLEWRHKKQGIKNEMVLHG